MLTESTFNLPAKFTLPFTSKQTRRTKKTDQHALVGSV